MITHGNEDLAPGALADAVLRDWPSDPSEGVEITVIEALTISCALWRIAAKHGLDALIPGSSTVTYRGLADAVHGAWDFPLRRVGSPSTYVVFASGKAQRDAVVAALRADEERRADLARFFAPLRPVEGGAA